MASQQPPIPGLRVVVTPSDSEGARGDLVAKFFFAGAYVTMINGKDTEEIAGLLRSMADLVEDAPIHINGSSARATKEWSEALRDLANFPTFPPNTS